jgi:hypothetical protein
VVRAEAEKLGLLVSECYFPQEVFLFDVEGVTDLACPENVGRSKRKSNHVGSLLWFSSLRLLS